MNKVDKFMLYLFCISLIAILSFIGVQLAKLNDWIERGVIHNLWNIFKALDRM